MTILDFRLPRKDLPNMANARGCEFQSSEDKYSHAMNRVVRERCKSGRKYAPKRIELSDSFIGVYGQVGAEHLSVEIFLPEHSQQGWIAFIVLDHRRCSAERETRRLCSNLQIPVLSSFQARIVPSN